MKTNTNQHAASTALEELDQKLGSSLKKIFDLKNRHKDIIDRQDTSPTRMEVNMPIPPISSASMCVILSSLLAGIHSPLSRAVD